LILAKYIKSMKENSGFESNWNGRCEDSYGRCGKLETQDACREGSSHAPWKVKYLE